MRLPIIKLILFTHIITLDTVRMHLSLKSSAVGYVHPTSWLLLLIEVLGRPLSLKLRDAKVREPSERARLESPASNQIQFNLNQLESIWCRAVLSTPPCLLASNNERVWLVGAILETCMRLASGHASGKIFMTFLQARF